MGALDLDGLPDGALLLIDSAPVIHVVEAHPKWSSRFRPVFEAHESGRFRLAITTIAIAEILTGPLKAGDEALARHYLSVLQSWQRIHLDLGIAETAARLRASLRLKMPDAIQAASALAINAAALITHDRDFARFKALPVMS